jgi:hypothetical protein
MIYWARSPAQPDFACLVQYYVLVRAIPILQVMRRWLRHAMFEFPTKPVSLLLTVNFAPGWHSIYTRLPCTWAHGNHHKPVLSPGETLSSPSLTSMELGVPEGRTPRRPRLRRAAGGGGLPNDRDSGERRAAAASPASPACGPARGAATTSPAGPGVWRPPRRARRAGAAAASPSTDGMAEQVFSIFFSETF